MCSVPGTKFDGQSTAVDIGLLSIALVTVRYQGLSRTNVRDVGMSPDNFDAQVFGAMSD